MKKKFIKIASLLLILIFVFSSFGCSSHEHTYTYYTITEATCSTDGEKEGICTICGQKIYVPISPAHQYAWQIITEPTCIQKGSSKGICVFCGHITTTEIPTQEHTYVGDVCTVCGHNKTYTYLHENQEIGWTLEKIQIELGEYGLNHTTDNLLNLARNSAFDLSLNSSSELNMIATINGLDYSINIGKKCIDFDVVTTNNNVISYVTFVSFGVQEIQCNVVYSDGTLETLGYFKSAVDSSLIRSFAINTNGELLIAYKDNHVISAGKIKSANTPQNYGLTYKKLGSSYTIYGVCDKNVEEVVVPPTHKGLPVNTISSSAFLNCRKLKRITLSNSIINIDAFAFSNCPQLNTVYSEKIKSSIYINETGNQQLLSANWIIK